MAEESVGIIRAFWRWISFYKWRKERAILRAADRQFTGSAEGIRDAFDIYKDKKIRQYRELRDAVAQVEVQLETKRQLLEEKNERETQLVELRDGALAKAEEVGETHQDYAKHEQAFLRYDTEIQEIEQGQEALSNEIKEIGDAMKRHLLHLTELQSEIEKLPRQQAEEIGKFVANKAIVELNDRIHGLQESIDKGPIDAVLEANRKLSAKARISEKLAGTDARLQDEEYQRAGREAASSNRMKQMLAARRAEREATEGTTSEKTVDDRPVI